MNFKVRPIVTWPKKKILDLKTRLITGKKLKNTNKGKWVMKHLIKLSLFMNGFIG